MNDAQSTEQLKRWLRRQAAIVLLLLPGICGLLPLLVMTPPSPTRTLIFVVWLVVLGAAIAINTRIIIRLGRDAKQARQPGTPAADSGPSSTGPADEPR